MRESYIPRDAISRSVDAISIANADAMVTQSPIGYVINAGPVVTKSPIYGQWQDVMNPSCVLVLIKWLDGSGVFVRYHHQDVVITG